MAVSLSRRKSNSKNLEEADKTRWLIPFLFTLMFFSVGQAGGDYCHPKTLLQGLMDVVDKGTCAELPIGVSSIVHFDEKNSPTSIPHKYELTRVSPDKYKIRLNLRLREDTLFARENTDLTKKMRAKIEKCLQWMNPRLLGPGHQKLEIELIDHSSERDAKKYHEIENWISVSEEEIPRAHAGLYSIRTECPVIAPELMHLVGLVDEYKELDLISWYEQDCRSFGPPDSVMAQEWEATEFGDDFPEKMFVSCCVCEAEKCSKKTARDAGSLKACPSGYKTVRQYMKLSKEGASDPQSSSQMLCQSLGMGFMGAGLSKDSFVLSTRRSRRVEGSFLYPAQFRAIVAPGCKEKNNLYYSCSRDAYFRPYKWIGNCNTRPAQCQSEDEWLQ